MEVRGEDLPGSLGKPPARGLALPAKTDGKRSKTAREAPPNPPEHRKQDTETCRCEFQAQLPRVCVSAARTRESGGRANDVKYASIESWLFKQGELCKKAAFRPGDAIWSLTLSSTDCDAASVPLL